MGFLATVSLIIVISLLLKEKDLNKRHNNMLIEMNRAQNYLWYDKCVNGKIFSYYMPTNTKCLKFQDTDINHVAYYYFIDYRGNLLGGQYLWGDKRQLSPNEIRALKKEANRLFDY